MNAQSTTSNTPPRRGQAGSLAVEMALVLPILVMLVLGILEIANILRIQTTLQSAATKTAHDAATHNSSTESAQQYIENNNLLPLLPQKPGADDTEAKKPEVTVTPDGTSGCKETPCPPIEVKITYVYKAIVPMMVPFFNDIQLSASAKKMSENY